MSNGIGESVENAIDLMLKDFVSEKCAAISLALLPIALTGTTIYLIVMGLAIARGEAEDSLQTFLKKCFRIALLASIAFGTGIYQDLIVNGSNSLERGLIDAVSGQKSMGALVDQMGRPFADLGTQIWNKAVVGFWPNFGLVFAAAIVAVAQTLLIGIGLGMFLLAKIGLALVLAIGPIYIVCAMWPSTEKYTESWIGQVLNYIVLKLLVAACLAMLMAFASQFAGHINVNQEALNVLKASTALLICSGALVVVVLNIPQIATALSGGSSISGIGRTVGRAFLDLLNKSSHSSKPKPPPGSKPQTRHPMPGSPPPRNQRPGGRIENASPNAIPSNPLYRRNTIERVRNKT